MKYIFATHSHTVHLSALGTINLLGLNSEDVIFVFTRNFKTVVIPDGCKVIHATDTDKLCYETQAAKNPIRSQYLIRKIDNEIDNWVEGDDYELFSPHLCIPSFLLLYTHSKCKRVSFIQEGLFTSEGFFRYGVSKWEQYKRKVYLLLRYGTSRLYGAPYWYCDGIKEKQSIIKAYGINEDYYHFLKCNFHKIEWPKVKVDLEPINEAPVFIFDGFVVNGMSESDYYMNQCREMIERFSKKNNYVRFHPNQSAEEKNMLLSFFNENGVSCKIMDGNVPFEYYIMQGEKMTIVGMGSTLLYLGQIYGHNVICCDTWMLDSPKYQQEMALGRPLFHEYFKDVKPVERTS